MKAKIFLTMTLAIQTFFLFAQNNNTLKAEQLYENAQLSYNKGDYTENNCWAMFSGMPENAAKAENDTTIASALGANGKFFIVNADALNLRSSGNTSSAIKMVFAQGSCLMSVGTSKENDGFVPVLAMGGGKKNITGYVSTKHIRPAPSGTNESNCIAMQIK